MNNKILIVAPHFYPQVTGYSNAITNLILSIEQYDTNINYTLICNQELGQEKELETKKGNIFRIRTLNWLPKFISFFIFEIILFLKIIKLSKKENYKFIFFETFERSLSIFLLTHSSLKNKIGVRIHGCTETEYFVWGNKFHLKFRYLLQRLSSKKIRFIFSTTQFYIDFYKHHILKDNILRISTISFFVIENFINPTNFYSLDSELEINKLNLKKEKYFLSLGRLDKMGYVQKGFIDFVQAAYLINKEDKDLLKDIKFLIVGNGKYKTILEDIVTELKIKEYFDFIDSLENSKIHILQRLSRATILISRFEGQSMFALEALSNGSVMLISDNNGIQNLVIPGKNGYKINTQNILEIKEALIKILRLSDKEIIDFKNHSKQLFLENFSSEKLIKKFEQIIEISSTISTLSYQYEI